MTHLPCRMVGAGRLHIFTCVENEHIFPVSLFGQGTNEKKHTQYAFARSHIFIQCNWTHHHPVRWKHWLSTISYLLFSASEWKWTAEMRATTTTKKRVAQKQNENFSKIKVICDRFLSCKVCCGLFRDPLMRVYYSYIHWTRMQIVTIKLTFSVILYPKKLLIITRSLHRFYVALFYITFASFHSSGGIFPRILFAF